MDDRLYMALMRALPRSALSAAVGKLVRAPAPAGLHHLAMRAFARAYDVQLDAAEAPLESYPTFAQFFTRRLKPGSRPLDPDPRSVLSPVDGTVSQVGPIERGRCLQAKGLEFPVGRLLGDLAAEPRFEGGCFATLYLAPRDYHRIHCPLEGAIAGFTYLPGEFWPVNPASVQAIDALFAINERLVTWLDTRAGSVAVVAVGATCVARIHAAYDEVTTHTGGPARSRRYPQAIPIERGAELAMFEMGSTVILLFEPGRVRLDEALVPGAKVVMGQRIGRLEPGKPS